MSNVVTEGAIGSLSAMLTAKMGRRVVVHRVEQTFKKPGTNKLSKSIRYTIAIDGAHPPMYFGMTVAECKARMAMLFDLFSSGVIYAASPDTGTDVRQSLSEDAFKLASRAARSEIERAESSLLEQFKPASGDDKY